MLQKIVKGDLFGEKRHEVGGNMEVDQIQCKFKTFSNSNGRLSSTKVTQNQKMDDQYPDEEEDGEREQITAPRGGGRVDLGGEVSRFYGWPSSRIVRVTRASGGKDRHSKVLTSKGLRDRRVRLSVNTAIQFYDLQDRLGYDQPSKAVEWLLKAAASSIAELPPMYPPFPDTPKQVRDEKRSSLDGRGDGGYLQQVTKSSACSSNSETSKGSLSRSEHRMKARERARERAAEKEKERDEKEVPCLNPNTKITSFTELLSGGFHHSSNNNETSSNQQWSMDYLSSGVLGDQGQMQLIVNNSLKRNPSPSPSPQQFTVTGYLNSELEFGPGEGQMVNGGDNCENQNHNHNHSGGSSFNLLNFGISSSSAGIGNRGTLQSNSSSLPPPHVYGTSSSSSTGLLMENQYSSGLHLFYAGHKGKGKK